MAKGKFKKNNFKEDLNMSQENANVMNTGNQENKPGMVEKAKGMFGSLGEKFGNHVATKAQEKADYAKAHPVKHTAKEVGKNTGLFLGGMLAENLRVNGSDYMGALKGATKAGGNEARMAAIREAAKATRR